jgi:hypothetical protein
MLRRIRFRRPSHATVVAYLALFVALGGTSAVALSGSNTVFSDDIANDNFNSPTEGQGGLVASDLRAGSVGSSEVANGSLKAEDYGIGSVSGARIQDNNVTTLDLADSAIFSNDVANNSLTGADIADQSGVDTCTHGSDSSHGTVRLGELCVVVGWEGASSPQTWSNALTFCTDRELRLPSLGEALAVAKNYDLPILDPSDYFWTEETYFADGNFIHATVNDTGTRSWNFATQLFETVCVTTPTN